MLFPHSAISLSLMPEYICHHITSFQKPGIRAGWRVNSTNQYQHYSFQLINDLCPPIFLPRFSPGPVLHSAHFPTPLLSNTHAHTRTHAHSHTHTQCNLNSFTLLVRFIRPHQVPRLPFFHTHTYTPTHKHTHRHTPRLSL